MIAPQYIGFEQKFGYLSQSGVLSKEKTIKEEKKSTFTLIGCGNLVVKRKKSTKEFSGHFESGYQKELY